MTPGQDVNVKVSV